MTQKTNSSHSGASALTQRSLLQGLSLVASLGILSSGVVWAEDAAMPTDSEPVAVEAAPVEAAPPEEAFIAPEPAAEAVEPEHPPETYAAPPEPEPAPADSYVAEPIPEPEIVPEAPAAEAPPEYLPEHPEVATPPVEVPHAETWSDRAPDNNAYIDPTDYSIGATGPYEAPTAVQFSERSSGCDAVLQLGQGVGNLCAPLPSEPVTAEVPNGGEPAWNSPAALQRAAETGLGREMSPPEALFGAGYSPLPGGVVAAPGYSAASGDSAAEPGYYEAAGNSGQYAEVAMASMGVAPIQVGPIAVSSMSNSGLAFYNISARPPALPGNGNIGLLFPLSIPAEITSAFGWREHPVLGYGRFHTGTDLGAPLGTPVLAAFAGQVAIADWLGGYGIAVVLDHNKQSLQTLYGHLSEIFVKPGEWVDQGSVIGRVGSTGMSTGPHLHFELRKNTPQGWVAVDPGQQLDLAVAQMVKTLRIAKVPQFPPQIAAAIAAQKTKDLETGLPALLPLPIGVEIEIHDLKPPLLDFIEEAGNSKAKTKNKN